MEKRCAGCRKENCDGCSLSPGKRISSIKDKTSLFPTNFRIKEREGYGIAFDVGTTTVAGMLADLRSGEILGARTCVNPQRTAGSDVVSRIVYCREKKENRKKLQRMTAQKLDGLARQLCSMAGKEERQTQGVPSETAFADRVTVVGNTAMCELLLGFDLKGLAKAPFHKEYRGSVTVKGSDLSLDFLRNAEVTVLPAIEGYVGADALSVYTYIRQQDTRENILAVDIGTNSEIILIGKDKVYACSAAAGPALEGASVRQGMGAAPGAIWEVGICGSFPRQDIFCRVIGDGKPSGICGSGLADALCVLRQWKVIDESGYLLSCQEARYAGVPERICRRLSDFQGENRFLLTDRESPVYLSAGDIRQLQLAKGAIRAGVEILLDKAGITDGELAHIYLAGAFGSYIKKESAVKIGLLPDIAGDRITQTGNCAGTGALMALLNPEVIRDMERDAGKIIHVELADEERFREHFMEFVAF